MIAGAHRKAKNHHTSANPTSFNLDDEKATLTRLCKLMREHGSRYIVGWDSIDGEWGHVICAENINGEIVFYDPQKGKNDCFWTLGEILKEANRKYGLQIIRIDNLSINYHRTKNLIELF